MYQMTGEDWTHTYETMSMGDYKIRAAEFDRSRHENEDNQPANQPVYENHPNSHSNLVSVTT
jgi:hypothetical protein